MIFEKRKLGDIYTFQYGTGNTIEDIGGDYPIYGSNGPVGFTDKYNSEDSPVIGHIGAYAGIVNWASGKHFVTYNGVICKAKDGVDKRFAYYTLLNANLTQRVRGSTQPFISYDLLNDVDILLPRLNEQHIIAKTLSNIDDIILTNIKAIEIFEKIAQEIYDYWFVQFDFPDENGRPYKTSGGKMIYEEKLKCTIPKNWSFAKMSSLITTKRGDWGSDIENSKNKTRVSCIRGADLESIRKGPIATSSIRYIPTNHKDRFLGYGDYIIEISGTPGRSAYINNNLLSSFDTPMISSNFCQIITLKAPYMLYWFDNLWKHFYENGIADRFSSKTTLKNLQFNIMADSIDLAIPDNNILKKFHEQVSDIYEYIQFLINENKNLISLRDWILPMLVNGQVRIND